MPTYLVRARTETLGPGRRARLAEHLTTAHADTTGTPPGLVQILIEDVQGRDHFIGGRLAPTGSVFVRGHVPADADEATMRALAGAARDAVVSATDVAAELVWVYLSAMAPEGVVEAGTPHTPRGAAPI